MLLLIDNRENQTRVKHVVDSFNETAISTEISQLDVCDYVGKDKDKILFGIEYKTYDDFTSSIANGHLLSQLNDMEGMEHPFLFIVGNYTKWITKPVRANLTLENISGFLVSASSRFKVKIIQFENENQAIKAMEHLFRVYLSDDCSQIQMPERKKRTGNPNLDMFLALPGVGKSKGQSYSKTMKFSDFINTCKYDDTAKQTLKSKGLSVTQTLIDYIKLL